MPAKFYLVLKLAPRERMSKDGMIDLQLRFMQRSNGGASLSLKPRAES